MTPEAVVRSCSVEKVFLEISQHSQGSTCARVSFLIKLHASGLSQYLLATNNFSLSITVKLEHLSAIKIRNSFS